MQTVHLFPLSHCGLDAVSTLDQLCLGGLWDTAGYSREIDSPNSDLLVLEPVVDSSTSQPMPDAESASLRNPSAPPSLLIGVGCCWAIVDEAHITLLAIHPMYRRQGFAKAILLELLCRARLKGLQWATLEVRISNKGAIALYESLGFQCVGERRKYYQDTGESALILWKKGLQTDGFRAELTAWNKQNKAALQQAGWQVQTLPASEKKT